MGSLIDRDASTLWEAWEVKKARKERRDEESRVEDTVQRSRMVAMARAELNAAPPQQLSLSSPPSPNVAQLSKRYVCVFSATVCRMDGLRLCRRVHHWKRALRWQRSRRIRRYHQ